VISGEVNVVVLVLATAPVVVVLTSRVFVIEGDTIVVVEVELTGV